MTLEEKDPFFDFLSHSRAFLERGRQHLSRFDAEEDVASLFYAALELRMGIEARVTEYLEVALKKLGKTPKDVSAYTASKLLAHLGRLAPDAERASTVRLVREAPRATSQFWYTPVTSELAQIHGRLGELLHYRFFVTNENWFLRQRLRAGAKSLVDFRDLLAEAEAGLAQATAGTLLGHPHFTSLVSEVLDEPDE